jgi:hypothetical protein
MPLWNLAQNNNLGDHQENDIETCSVILSTVNQSSFLLPKINNITISSNDWSFLQNVLPDISVYLNSNLYYSLHGITHTARVMLYSLIISKLLNIKYELPVFIASIHDIRRLNDRGDKEHGKRAGEYFLSNFNKNYNDFASKKDIIYYSLCNHNNIEYSNNFEINFYLDLLKTADALDRFRLPKEKWWCNANIIPFKFFNNILELFKIYVCRTEIDFITSKRIKNIVNVLKEHLSILIEI